MQVRLKFAEIVPEISHQRDFRHLFRHVTVTLTFDILIPKALPMADLRFFNGGLEANCQRHEYRGAIGARSGGVV